MVGQALQHVPDIHHQMSGRRIDRQPASVATEDLEPRLLGPQEQGDDVDILVRGRPHARVPVLDGGIVGEAQDAVADARLVAEPVRRQVQAHGGCGEQLHAQGVHGREQG